MMKEFDKEQAIPRVNVPEQEPNAAQDPVRCQGCWYVVCGSLLFVSDMPFTQPCVFCSSCPHTIYAVLPGTLVVLALLLSNYAYSSCDLVDCEGLGSVGLATIEAQDEREDNFFPCVRYEDSSDDLVDGAWKAARAFGIMSSVLGFVAVVSTLCMSCVAYPRKVVLGLADLLLVCSLFDILVLVGLAAEFLDKYDCQMSVASYVALAASLCWCASAAAVAFTPKPRLSGRSTIVPVHNRIQC